MRRMIKIVSGLGVAAMLALNIAAQTPASAKTTAAPKQAKHMTKSAPKSDVEIQADIQKRLADAPRLKSENISVSVSGGVATFVGVVKNSGSKGVVNSLAKSAGAKSVVNNLTVEKAMKAAPPAKTAAPAKKP